jgi:DNA-binding response OmpR family regulator
VKQIIIINEHPETGHRLRGYLTDCLPAGYELLLLSAVELQSGAHSLRPAIVILDTAVGRQNWQEMCRELQARYHNAMILVITNRSSILTENWTGMPYIHGIIDKTMELDKLCNIIVQSDISHQNFSLA